MKKMTLFILAFILWVLLVWPVDPVTGEIHIQPIVVGLIAAALVALIMREVSVQKFHRWLNPVRYFWGAAYLIMLFYYIFKANLDVAYRVLHPAIPIRPGIVKVRTTLRTASGITLLANSITLTPGTLTVDVTDDGELYIHWINVQATDVAEASRIIVERFEWFIRKIVE